MPASSVLIGSDPNWTTQTLTSPSGSISASLGALYLDHDTAALSFIEQLKLISNVANAFIRQDGRLQIDLTSAAALTWGGATTARDFAGFTGDKGSATSHVADEVSPYLWCPLRREEPLESVIGSEGVPRHLIDVAQMRDGTQVVVRFGQNRMNGYRWHHVPLARFMTADEGDGEYRAFFDQVVIRGSRFLMYRDVAMTDSGSSAASLSSPLGPFQADMRRTPPSLDTVRSPGHERVDRTFDVDLYTIKVAEYA